MRLAPLTINKAAAAKWHSNANAAYLENCMQRGFDAASDHNQGSRSSSEMARGNQQQHLARQRERNALENRK